MGGRGRGETLQHICYVLCLMPQWKGSCQQWTSSQDRAIWNRGTTSTWGKSRQEGGYFLHGAGEQTALLRAACGAVHPRDSASETTLSCWCTKYQLGSKQKIPLTQKSTSRYQVLLWYKTEGTACSYQDPERVWSDWKQGLY